AGGGSNARDPERNICHYMNYACNISPARNDCCAAPGNSGACQLDPLGVPRCYGIAMCRLAGESCSSEADCCHGGPWISAPNGVLRCLAAPDGGPACSPAGGSCTSPADCCAGLSCNIPPGSTRGTCGTTPGYDGGVCSMFGQMCNANEPCCNGLSCYV